MGSGTGSLRIKGALGWVISIPIQVKHILLNEKNNYLRGVRCSEGRESYGILILGEVNCNTLKNQVRSI